MSLQTLGQIAEASAKLVDLIYEFEGHPDLLGQAISEHLEHLDDLLIAGGYRPEPHIPTPEEIDEWIKTRVADAHRDRD
jgi:hypothetical protein